MIFLKDINLLFLKPRKVGGTSFEIALSSFASKHDIITPISPRDETYKQKLGFRGAQRFKKGIFELRSSDVSRLIFKRRYPRKYYNHISAQDARKRLGARVFDDAYKVSIVRNPFDMLISQYYWATRYSSKEIDFLSWTKRNSTKFNVNDAQYLIDGTGIIDQFIRFENFVDDTSKLELHKPQLKGLSDIIKNINAKSGIRPKNATIEQFFSPHPELIDEVLLSNSWIVDRFSYHHR